MKKYGFGIICAALCVALGLGVFCACGTDENSTAAENGTAASSVEGVNSDIPQRDSFTDDGMPLVSVSRDSAGNVIGFTKYEYDNGNMTKQTKYDGKGNLTSYWINEFDSENRETKSTEYDSDGKVSGYIEYEYNSEGCIAKTYDAEGELIREKKEYEELIQ